MGYLLFLFPFVGTALVIRWRGWRDRFSFGTLGLLTLNGVLLADAIADRPNSALSLFAAGVCWVAIFWMVTWCFGLKVRESTGREGGQQPPLAPPD